MSWSGEGSGDYEMQDIGSHDNEVDPDACIGKDNTPEVTQKLGLSMLPVADGGMVEEEGEAELESFDLEMPSDRNSTSEVEMVAL